MDQKSTWNFTTLQPWNDPAHVSENERLLGGLAYISQILLPVILPAILLLSEESQKSLFLRYHAIHSLALLALTVVYDLLALFVFILSVMIWGCFFCLAWVIFLPPLLVLGYYGWQAFAGRAPIIPWLTEFLTRHGLL